MNNTTISGRAWEPECKYLDSGMCITEISVSVYDGKDKEGKAKYFSVKVKMFKELAENAGNIIRKGDNVIATGRLTEEKWEKDGQTVRRLVLIADSIGTEISRFAQEPPIAATKTGADSFGSQLDDSKTIPF